jgi:exodeoxyribonuclease-3
MKIATYNEIKTSDPKFPAQALKDAGYGAIWHGQRSHHGVAILTEVRGLVIASVYLPNGNPQPGPKFDFKLAWFERLIAHAAALHRSGRPVVMAGDFNVVPTNADIYNPWVWRFDAVMQPQTRAAYQRLLAQGWTDATRHLHPKDRIYTFWVNADAHRRNAGREKPSDHAPVWVRI